MIKKGEESPSGDRGDSYCRAGSGCHAQNYRTARDWDQCSECETKAETRISSRRRKAAGSACRFEDCEGSADVDAGYARWAEDETCP